MEEMRANAFTTLRLAGKGIDVVGSMVVAGLVPAMPSLTRLVVSGNPQLNRGGDGEGVKLLRDAVRGREGFELIE